MRESTARPIHDFARRYAAKRLSLTADDGNRCSAEIPLLEWCDGSADLEETMDRVGSPPEFLEQFLLLCIVSEVSIENLAELVAFLGLHARFGAFHVSAGPHLAFLACEEMLDRGEKGRALALLSAVQPLPRDLSGNEVAWPQMHHLQSLMRRKEGDLSAALAEAEKAIEGISTMFPAPDAEYLDALLELRAELVKEKKASVGGDTPPPFGLDVLWLEIREARQGREGRWRAGQRSSSWMNETEVAVARMHVVLLTEALRAGKPVEITSREFGERLLAAEGVAVSDPQLRKVRGNAGDALESVLEATPFDSQVGSKGGLVFDPAPLREQGIRTVTSRETS